MKKYKTGLVVGKFCPLHKGHQYLIDTAMQQCQTLIILSYTKPGFENCESEKRRNWLSHLYPSAISLVVDDIWMKANSSGCWLELPHNEASDETHRRFCAWLCFDVLKQTPDVVFSSEDYGDGFASSLKQYIVEKTGINHSVQHECLDKARTKVPVSGTDIRQSPFQHRQYLDAHVYEDFVKRVLVLGGESTGKTTLCRALAKRLDTLWVPEYGRFLWEEKQGQLTYADLLKIGKTQVEHEEGLLKNANRWLFCDTSPLTTLFYSHAMFSKAEAELDQLAERKYDEVFLCDADFDFVQDGTRKDDGFRQRQQNWYLEALKKRKIDFTILSGHLDERVERVLNEIGE